MKPSLQSEKYFADYFHIERNMIVAAVFILINPPEFRLVHNQKKNCKESEKKYSVKVSYSRKLFGPSKGPHQNIYVFISQNILIFISFAGKYLWFIMVHL